VNPLPTQPPDAPSFVQPSRKPLNRNPVP